MILVIPRARSGAKRTMPGDRDKIITGDAFMPRKNKNNIREKRKRKNRKDIVKFMREYVETFDGVDLRKPVSDAVFKRASRQFKAIDSKLSQEKIKWVRPRKSNRALYAEYSGVSKNFKKYPVPIIHDEDSFSVIKVQGKKRIKREGRYTTDVLYTFEDQKKLVKNPEEETKKLFKKLDKKYGRLGRDYSIRIKCGEAEYKPIYKDKSPHVEISEWIASYGKIRVKKFCLGFQVYTYKNQAQKIIEKSPKKGDKKPRKSRRERVRFK